MGEQETYTAFDGGARVAGGSLHDVVLKVKRRLGRSENSSVLIFSDTSGHTIDFNFHGSLQDVERRLDTYVGRGDVARAAGPGRPKLGVMSREVSLLPRHWEWLAHQPGGASATIRKLVEEARRRTSSQTSVKHLQERAYRFISVVAGNLDGYEEALRALYRSDREGFVRHVRNWPADVKNHAEELAQAVFASARAKDKTSGSANEQ